VPSCQYCAAASLRVSGSPPRTLGVSLSSVRSGGCPGAVDVIGHKLPLEAFGAAPFGLRTCMLALGQHFLELLFVLASAVISGTSSEVRLRVFLTRL